MYAADARTVAAIGHHRSEQLRQVGGPRRGRIVARLRLALTRQRTSSPASGATAGQPAC